MAGIDNIKGKDMKEKTQLEMVKEFHQAFNLHVAKNNSQFENPKEKGHCEEIRSLRRKLLREEFEEYMAAEAENDFVEIADALADMIYIANGTALSYGIPLDPVFKEVHRSNMNKLGKDGKPIYREDGKVTKPEGWTAPQIEDVLIENKEV